MVPDYIRTLVKQLYDQGVAAFLVGGAVRDMLLDQKPLDFDLEVFGDVENVSLPYEISFTDRKYGVYRVNIEGQSVELTKARVERKTGVKHNEFEFDFSPASIQEAAKRRDFTINALYYDVLAGEYLDPTGRGLLDLHNGYLSPVSNATFVEDPLRFLRGFQLAARLAFVPTPEFCRLAQAYLYTFDSISKDAQWHEWQKFLTAPHRSMGIDYLIKTGWIANYSWLDKMRNVKQNPLFHPEGDVLRHTLAVLERTDRNPIRAIASLLHDSGKINNTQLVDGVIHHYNHESDTHYAEMALEQIGFPEKDRPVVLNLIKNHMRLPKSLPGMRRLARDLAPATLKNWMELVISDRGWRAGTSEVIACYRLACIEGLGTQAPKLPINGDDVMRILGIPEGPKVGKVLRDVATFNLDANLSREELLRDLEEQRKYYV